MNEHRKEQPRPQCHCHRPKHLDSIEGHWTPSRPRNPLNWTERRSKGIMLHTRKPLEHPKRTIPKKKVRLRLWCCCFGASGAKQSVESSSSTPSRPLGKRVANRAAAHPELEGVHGRGRGGNHQPQTIVYVHQVKLDIDGRPL